MLERLFKRREPQYEPDVDPDALQVFDMVVGLSKERNRLRDENERLRIAVADVGRERDFFREQMEEAQYHRDFYMRHYIALDARTQDRISELQNARNDAAREATENRIPTPAVNLDEIERSIQDLVQSTARPDEQSASAGREAALASHQLEEPKP